MITGNREEHGLILDAHCTGIRNGRLQVGHIDIDVETRMRRQRYGDGIRTGLRVGLLLAALVGLFHAVGVGKALLDLGGGRKRGQNRNAEFDAYRGLLGPVLRIGIGDRGRGRGALFIGIAFLDRVFEVVAVFRRHLVAVRAAAQIKLVALLLERRRCVVRRDGGRLKPVCNALNFEVVERLHIVAVAGTYIRVMVIAFPLRSGRDIINRGFFFRKAVQNTRAAQNRTLVNDAADSIPQTLGCILYLCIICRRQSGIRLMIAVFIVVVIVRFWQNIVRNSRPLLRKFGAPDHLLQNLLLCARQVVGIRGIKDLPVVLRRHRRRIVRFLLILFSSFSVVFLLRHGQKLVVAQLYVAEADKNAVRHRAVPDLRVGKRPEAELVQIRLHVQQEPAPGDEIDLKHMTAERTDGLDVFPLHLPSPPFSECR